MPFPRDHLLLTVIGDAWSQQEEWAYGFRIDRPALPTEAEMDAIETAVATFHQSSGSQTSVEARLTSIKVAPIGTDGRYPAGAEAVERFVEPAILGTASTGAIPQQTLVVSLYTIIPRGRGSKGRFYPPIYSGEVQSTGRISTVNQQGMLDAALAMLTAVQDALQADIVVGSQLGEGQLARVDTVRVGGVVDTQRRRRESIPEAYIEAGLSPFL